MTAADILSADKRVIAAVRNGLQALYGDRLNEIALFGSRARGDHNEESDYDVAVFLSEYDLDMSEVLRLADLSWNIQAELDAIVSFKPFPAGASSPESALLEQVRRDGIAI
jgi:predicted nucleotidyltransferase